MFGKFELELKERLTTFPIRKVKYYQMFHWLLLAGGILALFIMTIQHGKPSLLYSVIVFIIALLLIIYSYKVIKITVSVELYLKRKEQENVLLESLKTILSSKDYKAVIYVPKMQASKKISEISNMEKNLKVNRYYYAKLTERYVEIIVKNENGRVIAPSKKVSAIEFANNYIIYAIIDTKKQS